MKTPPTVSPQDWEAAREELLVKEKELTRTRAALAAERRRMPWMEVEKEYAFEGPDGTASLLDLFEGRRQLIVYRFYYGPEVTTYAEGALIRSGAALAAPSAPTRSRISPISTPATPPSRTSPAPRKRRSRG